jgi:CHASE3 domain sensor protein
LLAQGIAWPVLLVALYCGAIFYQMLHNQAVRATQVECERRVSEGRNLRTMLLDMETGIRGYLLTRETSYLHPYTQASPELPSEMTRLAQVSANDPSSVQQLKIIETDVQNWVNTAHIMVNTQSTAGKIDAQLVDQAKHEFDTLRDSIQAYLKISLDADTAVDSQIIANRDRFKMLAIMGAVALAAGLILCTLVLVRRIAQIYHLMRDSRKGRERLRICTD